VLSRADAVLLTEVYSAGEPALVAADGRALARGVRVAGKVEPLFVEDVSTMPQEILNFAKNGDVVIVMGAGSISKVPSQMGVPL
jgi:UDP-N-acetylmuramate--alanine ligase